MSIDNDDSGDVVLDPPPVYPPHQQLPGLEQVANKNREVQQTTEKQTAFQKELEQLLNQHSVENQSDTPDFILASYLNDVLKAWNDATKARQKWWGHKAFNLDVTTLPPQTTDQPAPHAG